MEGILFVPTERAYSWGSFFQGGLYFCILRYLLMRDAFTILQVFVFTRFPLLFQPASLAFSLAYDRPFLYCK